MPLNGLILGVDLDGVCADFYARMREIAAEWFECDIDSLPLDVSYSLKEWGINSMEEYESLHRFAVTRRDLFRTSPMIPGARRYLRQLSDEGVRIRIITHRLFIHFFHHTAVSQTIDWLDHHGVPLLGPLLHEGQRAGRRRRLHRRFARQRRPAARPGPVHDLLWQQHQPRCRLTPRRILV